MPTARAHVGFGDRRRRPRARVGQRGAADHRRPRHGGGLVVRTCNGLLCLCDNKKPGGEISPANPATGETLGIPPVPVSYLGTHGYCSWNEGAQLRVHPGDGAVRDPAPPVPRRAGDLLGEASWREARVRAQDARRGEVRSVRIGEPGTAAAYFKNGSYGAVESLQD